MSRQWQGGLFLLLALCATWRLGGANRLAHHTPGYLAACLLSRNGNHDIREWVEYHLFAGVNKIFLFDHNSTIPMLPEIADYAVSGHVQYTYMSSELPKVSGDQFLEGLQGRVFQECFAQARGYYKWMMFTDLDEWVMVTNPDFKHSIPAVLRYYEEAGAVLVHRMDMGSGGVKQREADQGMLNTFTKCVTGISPFVKGIANLEYASTGVHAHAFRYTLGRTGVRLGDNQTVTDNHKIADPPVDAPLLLYHFTGSIAEYTERVAKMAAGVSGITTKSLGMYMNLDGVATKDCTAGRDAHLAMAAAGAIRQGPPLGWEVSYRRRHARRTHKQAA